MNNQMNEPKPKIQKLNIYDIINEVKNSNLNSKDDKINYLKKYKYIENDYTFLYNIIINNDLKNSTSNEMKILNIMLSKVNQLNNNDINKIKCDEDIGQVLVNEYVKPLIEKNKEENKKRKIKRNKKL